MGPFLTGTGPSKDCFAEPIAVLDNYLVPMDSWKDYSTYYALEGQVVTSQSYHSSSTCYAHTLNTRIYLEIPYVLPSNHMCTICPAGTFKALQNLKACILCPVGTNAVQSGNTVCQQCEKGKYTSTRGVSIPCSPCPSGKFSDSLGTSQCTDCPVHTYHPLTGATSQQTCQPCPSDLGSPAGSSLLSDCVCKYGFYENSESSCTQCEYGKYSDQLAASECNTCGSNKYASDNRTKCQPCPEYSFSESGGASINDCTCKAGYASSTTAYCEICGIGKYSFLTQDSGVECHFCRNNSNSPAGSSSVDDCRCIPGWTRGGGGVDCAACDQGKYKPGFNDDACIKCAPGTYLDSEGAARYMEIRSTSLIH